MNKSKQVIAILLAAGQGTRMKSDTPKQLISLGGRTLLSYSLDRLMGHNGIDRVILVLAPGMKLPFDPPCPVVEGGATRQQSVQNALNSLQDQEASILIHDAARPFVTAGSIDRLIAAHQGQYPATLAVPVVDTMRKNNGETIPRDDVYAIQTPQIFDLHALRQAYQDNQNPQTDDAGLFNDVVFVQGDRQNFKVTTADDLIMAHNMIGPDIRTGIGYDVHQIALDKTHITLFGVTLPHDFGLSGHSDADVGLHAITDAIYGAIGEGDIGRHFPPGEARWKDADSRIFIDHALSMLGNKGGRLTHIDATLICETPKMTPHYEAMKTCLSGITTLPPERIGLKATTSERLGFTGRGEGIAAQAVATVQF